VLVERILEAIRLAFSEDGLKLSNRKGRLPYLIERMSRRISRRCLVFNDYVMHMITDEMPRFHPRYSHRMALPKNSKTALDIAARRGQANNILG
jgi:hypothetical protein